MDFRTYYLALSPRDKRRLAKALGTSVAYLSQLAHGHRRAGVRILTAIEPATGGRVRREELRPDIFRPPAGPPGSADPDRPEPAEEAA